MSTLEGALQTPVLGVLLALFSCFSFPMTWIGQYACQIFKLYIVKSMYILYVFSALLFQKLSAYNTSFSSKSDRGR